MGTILYNLTIFPLAAIIEVFYLLFSRVAHSPGLAIVGVSLAVNVLALPLYAKAEKWQALEREIQKRLKPKIDDIKAVFKGDERLMILSTYYRQNGYHPFYALRSSFGLLLQIPFFIAAYAFIANLPELQGRSFWFIRDLSAQDGLVAIGAVRINLLPLVMTLINVAASAVYTRGLALREKVQLYGMAAIFLALLYTSPSALVLYWTLNNVFSLFKNLVYRARKPLRAFYLIMSGIAVAAVSYTYLGLDTTPRKRLVVLVIGAIVLLSPLFAAAAKRLLERHIGPALADERDRAALFFLSIASLVLLVGAVIPMNIIGSSTQEFSFVGGRDSPFGFVALAFSQAAGILLFWPLVLYYLFGGRAKAAMVATMAALLAAALLDAFAFGGAYGTISRQLVFPDPGLLKPSAALGAANAAAVLALAAAVLVLVAARRTRALKTGLVICLISLTAVSGYKAYGIAADYASFKSIRGAEGGKAAGAELKPMYRFSRGGKNVIVIMLDRAINAFVPYILKDDPKLAETYRGFTLYPNTVSTGGHTLTGAPLLFGGYDYSPDEMNRRSNESLVAKHDEALSLMPRIFAEAGWESTISDASWANYSWVPDNRVFEKYPGVRSFNLEGMYTQRWLAEHGMETDPSRNISRNLIRFGLFRIAPMTLRFGLYDGGKWWDSKYVADEYSDFIGMYAPLDYLPKLVEYEDKGNTFTLMVNNATHETVPLQYPECVPSRKVEASGPGPFADEFTWQTYLVNLSAIRLVGRLLDDLRAHGAYDNTEIIIVSDHGFELANPAFAGFKEHSRFVSFFNPLLMVKGFGDKAPFSENGRFGTNGDVPAIATAVLGAAVNPFTKKPLRMLEPGKSVRVVLKSIYDPASQGKNTFTYGEDEVATVHDTIFEESDWSFPR